MQVFSSVLGKVQEWYSASECKKAFRKSPYRVVAMKLVQYVEIRSRRFEYDKCG